MYIGEKYKEGIIYQTSGMIFLRIRCRCSTSDESIYKTLKKLTPLLNVTAPLYQVNTIFRNVLDQAPEEEGHEPGEIETEDSELIVPKGEFIISNMIFTDKEIYGEHYDGEKRTYRIIWIDEKGEEYFVPLEGIDTGEGKNPNGAYSYNSETKELSFKRFMPYDTTYILRRYKYFE